MLTLLGVIVLHLTHLFGTTCSKLLLERQLLLCSIHLQLQFHGPDLQLMLLNHCLALVCRQVALTQFLRETLVLRLLCRHHFLLQLVIQYFALSLRVTDQVLCHLRCIFLLPDQEHPVFSEKIKFLSSSFPVGLDACHQLVLRGLLLLKHLPLLVAALFKFLLQIFVRLALLHRVKSGEFRHSKLVLLDEPVTLIFVIASGCQPALEPVLLKQCLRIHNKLLLRAERCSLKDGLLLLL
mmetsp:Transcript_96725/g.156035  ORF Transcript_96725/g.156035 Transcript_96725/m.156035 type:complete len:238 (-) Transcript_96725:6805-7518(-)